MYTEKDARKIWGLMIRRCSEGYAKVCDEWKNYINFKEWYFENIYGTKQFKMQLDKDLFSKGQKIYSPETCCFLPQSLNTLLASCTSRNEFLPGVQITRNKTFKAKAVRNITSIEKVFKTEDEAFQFYKHEKEENIRISTEAYSFLLPRKIYMALMGYEISPARGKNHYSLKKKY